LTENNIISNYCVIRNNEVIVDGKTVYKDTDGKTFSQFIKGAYREFNISYPKFFKMDNLSKLGFVAAELLVKNVENQDGLENTGVVVSNSSSSLDTDTKYQASIANRSDYFPSPSVFVYTLPNIMVGEICIRHNIKGENACLISKEFDPELLVNYVRATYAQRSKFSCITGWLECFDNSYEAVLYFVRKGNDKKANFEPSILNSIYQKIDKTNGRTHQ